MLQQQEQSGLGFEWPEIKYGCETLIFRKNTSSNVCEEGRNWFDFSVVATTSFV